MRSVLSIILIYSLAITSVFAQSVNPNDTLKIGNKSSSSDKGITFDTNDGVNNKKLLVEKISKKLKWDGNSVQIGDGSSSSDKELVIAGALKSLKYNGTTGEFEFNDDLKLSGELKSDILRAINTEVAVKSLLRAEQGIKVGTGSNEIRVNAGNLEFSNDGVLYKKFGTGTGTGGSGGFNLITNDSFEDGIGSPWTSSGGTFTQETYAVGFEGNTKYARFVASGSGQYVEQIVSVPTSFSGGCQADFKKVNVSTAGLFKVQALDASDNVLAEQTIGVSSWIKVPTFGFPCPTSGTNNLKLRMISISAGTIDFDLGYIGSNQNLVNIAQAKLLGTVTISGCAGSFVNSSTTLSNPTAQTGCIYTTTGQAVADTSFGLTQLPSIKFNRIEAGEIRVEYEGGLRNQTTAKTAYFQFSDGTNNARELSTTLWSVSAGTGYAFVPSISQSISYSTAQNNVSIVLRSKTDSGGITEVTGSTANPGVIKVWHFPSTQEQAVNTDQASWFIDANIGGGNPATTNTSSYTPFENASLDLVLNPGSASAEIPCSSTNPSTGLTCSVGNEQVGIAFIPPYPGIFEACLTSGSGTSGIVTSANQWVETANNSQAIIQEGKSRINNDSSAAGQGAVVSNCGTFTFSDISKRTLRFSYEANSTAFSLMADRSAAYGQRDIKITVKPLLSAFNRPILTGDQVTTPNAAKPVIISSEVSSTGVLSSNFGFSTCTAPGSGAYVCSFTKPFLSNPNCWAFLNNSVATVIQRTAISTTSVSFQNQDTVPRGAGANASFTAFCHGILP